MSFQQFRRYLADDYITRTGGKLKIEVQSDYLSRLNRLQRAASLSLEELPLASLQSLATTFRADSKIITGMSSKVQSDIQTTLRHYIQFRGGDEVLPLDAGDAVSIEHDEIVDELRSLDFVLLSQTQKVSNLSQGDISLYVKRGTATEPLVVHSDFQAVFSYLRSINGVLSQVPLKWYHSSNMGNFRLRQNSGKGPTRYGIAFGFISRDALRRFVQAIVSALDGSIEIESGVSLRAQLRNGRTEREVLVQARIGQGRFRDDLIELWGGICPISGVTHPELLRASHIKPWAASTDEERLDPYNGLLLAVHLDAVFDRALISFDPTGEMLVSNQLSVPELLAFGLSKPPQFLGIDRRHLGYLSYHNMLFQQLGHAPSGSV